jgi:hypothetical protein
MAFPGFRGYPSPFRGLTRGRGPGRALGRDMMSLLQALVSEAQGYKR